MPTTRTEIIPYLFYRDVPAAVAWLSRAFGFVADLSEATPSGGIHAEMSFDGRRIMMGQLARDGDHELATPADGGRATVGIFIYLDDVDGHHARAAAAGAVIEHPPQDRPYGRTYAARDPENHPWYFTTPPDRS